MIDNKELDLKTADVITFLRLQKEGMTMTKIARYLQAKKPEIFNAIIDKYPSETYDYIITELKKEPGYWD